jgi:formyltetrahydrofolate deformylase
MKSLANIVVIGKDRTGVVARVTNFLFQVHANIEEIEQQVTRGRFSMSLQASWPSVKLDKNQVELGLRNLGKTLGMEIRARFVEKHARQRIALFMTKEPECPEAVIAAVKRRKIPAEIGVVVSNHQTLKGLAKRAGAPFFFVDYSDRDRAERSLLAMLEEHEVDWIVLARFMKILSPDFVWRYKNKILNIHPSLLPAFPGASAYRQAYERGVKIIGVSAHIVTMDLDEGPIICQDCFKLPAGASYSEIVSAGRRLEAQTLVRAIQLCLKKRLDIHWGVVHNV